MRKTLLTATLAVLSIPVFASQTTTQSAEAAGQSSTSSVKKLSRSEIDELLGKPGQVLFIDVRRPDEISSIGGFPVYLSIQINDLENELANIPRDKQIVTVSNHAARATKAADLLVSKGFQVIGAVGAQNYETEGGHLVKIAVRAAAATTAAANLK